MDLINYVNLSNYYSNEFYLFEIFLILSYVFVVTGTIFYLKLLRDSYFKKFYLKKYICILPNDIP